MLNYIEVDRQFSAVSKDKDDLQDIENYTPPFSIGNEHIGLKNLLSRFYYFYDGNAFIHLCNPKTGGACAEVKIPIEL